VLKAKRQVALLSPAGRQRPPHDALAPTGRGAAQCREALKAYFAGLKLGLLDKRLAGLAEDWRRQDAQVRRLDGAARHAAREEAELKQNIADNGGDRLERLAAEIRKQDQDARRASARRNATPNWCAPSATSRRR
jgi:uncharacterized protein YPO0396